MKYTNIKKLLIKFMGGGLINFPTRFLRWVKIDGDAESDDSGDDSSNDVFFVPATIQPKYFLNNDGTEVIEIKNYTSDIITTTFLYNKEDIISLGIEEANLNSLTQVTIEEAYEDSYLSSPIKGLHINKEVFTNTFILNEMVKEDEYGPYLNVFSFNIDGGYCVYKISDDTFLILQYSMIS